MVIKNSISDVHCMVTTQFRCHVPKRKPRNIVYRSVKTLSKTDFLSDLESANLQQCADIEGPNNAWKYLTDKFRDVLDTHAPKKTRKVRPKPAPFMNSELRKAIMTRKRLHHNYLANRTHQNWELYRQQRNICVSLRRKAMKGYFQKNCEKGPAEGKGFWDTVKPFLTNKGPSTNCDIILSEDNKIVSNQNDIAEIFNNFFCKCSLKHRGR